jgi:spore maturation protein CgeB
VSRSLDVVVLGLSVSSSWGNGHATTYRGLLRALARRGHRVTFLERDTPWYAGNRDMPQPEFCRLELYDSLAELRDRFAHAVRDADLVIVGSYVPEGVDVGEWVIRTARGATAFYDIDTPVTLAKLARGDDEYLTAALIPRYDAYLSFTGGPTLDRLEREYGSPMARALYCSVDPALYFPEPVETRWDLGYMGTYSDDRQPTLNELLVQTARVWPRGRFTVVGPQYPEHLHWPRNVQRIGHLAPREHRAFYNAQRFTLNVTRADMVAAGWSPSVRLFEAAACGTPIVSDYWDGLDDILEIGTEVLVARSAADVLEYLREMPEEERSAIGVRARERVLAAAHRAAELEQYALELLGGDEPARRAAGRVRESHAEPITPTAA